MSTGDEMTTSDSDEPDNDGGVNAWNRYQKLCKARGMKKNEILQSWMAKPEEVRKSMAGRKMGRIRIRCYPGSLAKVVSDKMGRISIKAEDPWLSDSPFRGLLRLVHYKLNKNLIKKIAMEFNTDEKSIIVSGTKHILRVQDIIDILQLNSEMDEDVRYTLIENEGVTKRIECEPSESTVNMFCSPDGKHALKFVKMEMVCDIIKTELNSENRNKENLKKAFSVAALHSIVYAPACGKLGHRELGMVENVENIKTFPWGNLAMEYLMNGIGNYQKGEGKKNKKDKKKGKKKMKIDGKKAGTSMKKRESEVSIVGCMIVLQLYYLMKLTNKPITEILDLNSKQLEKLIESESELNSESHEFPEWNEKFEDLQLKEHNQRVEKHLDLLNSIDTENMSIEMKMKVKELMLKVQGLGVEITKELRQKAIIRSASSKSRIN